METNNAYTLEFEIYRPEGKDYSDDVVISLKVNDEDFQPVQEKEGATLREWANSIGVPFKGASKGHLKNRLAENGYLFDFIEQYHLSDNTFKRIYVVKPKDEDVERLRKRMEIASKSSSLTAAILDNSKSDHEVSSVVREQCEAILKIADAMSSSNIAYRSQMTGDWLLETEEIREYNGLSTGKLVQHPKFGKGVVVSLSRLSNDYEVTVAFENCGIKRLQESLANLVVVEN